MEKTRKRKMMKVAELVSITMSEFWNKVYKSDNTFFGDNPSNFAIRCYNHMKENTQRKY